MLLEAEDANPGTVVDRAFIDEHCHGFAEYEASIRTVDYDTVLEATGGRATVEELYRLMGAAEAAYFLGLALQTLRNMSARGELPVIKTGKRGVGYRLIDLIDWQEARTRPPQN